MADVNYYRNYMKRPLLIDPKILGACCVAVFPALVNAQTSVQLYGLIDLSLNSVSSSGTGGGSGRAVTSDVSLWGFRGSEDLGGGLSAIFKLEQGFNADTGAQTSATALFNREALVGLADKRWGTVQLGAQYWPIITLTARTDPFQRRQMGQQLTLLQGSALRGYPVQSPNAIQYFSPTIGGFQARAMYQVREGAAANNKAVLIDYTSKDVYVGVNLDSAEVPGPAATATAPARPAARSNNIAVGGAYSLPMLRLFGFAQRNRTAGLARVNGYMLGTAVPVGAGEFRVSYSSTSNPGAEARLVALGYNHFLSKRTQVYTTIAHLKNDGAARFGLRPSVTDLGAPGAGDDQRGLQLGVRHTF